MIKREAQFTTLFRHWLMVNYMPSCAFELKQTTTDSIPFSDVKEHQIDALLAVKWGRTGLLYKAPDDSRAIKPFDMFYLIKAPAYIVIKYPHFFVIIDVDRFIKERDTSTRKSLTSAVARKIALTVVDLR